jgi:hypothetical protein
MRLVANFYLEMGLSPALGSLSTAAGGAIFDPAISIDSIGAETNALSIALCANNRADSHRRWSALSR